ncbi:MAG: GTP 3',8-cyclase MoaA [Sulfobacillus acidophilus]|uniref:GTP 3',8-cyclase n=1 Tax=Sulfobacillus acidophilus TaxID=53633 RepID=A0A2T2WMZ6_9FIRM|nr:MAG: GTP 3',8-cyclase MoaA [Sulfobacillus acidophilus]
MSHTTDRLGRPLQDLRISVTDRCNFRCVYCMPKAVFGPSFAFLPRQELLTFEEIVRVASIFAELGVHKIRLTGGEPLVRKDIEQLVSQLRVITGIDDLAMTTNGSLLTRERAQRLKDAGLMRVTVSLDSLDNDKFQAINDVKFPVKRVIEAIDNAAQVGLAPIKINMVVKRQVNDSDVLPMAEYFRGTGHILRFIEYMDVGTANGWRLDDVVPASEIVARIESKWPLIPIAPKRSGDVARRFRYQDGAGEIGVISSVSQPFCQNCSRARLSPEGQLFLCLFAQTGFDLRRWLRKGHDDSEIRRVIENIWQGRSVRYSEERSEQTVGIPKVEMFRIGG